MMNCPFSWRKNRKEIAENELENMESATEEFFSDVILSSAETQKLFPSNILVFDWCLYEPLRSNIEL